MAFRSIFDKKEAVFAELWQFGKTLLPVKLSQSTGSLCSFPGLTTFSDTSFNSGDHLQASSSPESFRMPLHKSTDGLPDRSYDLSSYDVINGRYYSRLHDVARDLGEMIRTMSDCAFTTFLVQHTRQVSDWQNKAKLVALRQLVPVQLIILIAVFSKDSQRTVDHILKELEVSEDIYDYYRKIMTKITKSRLTSTRTIEQEELDATDSLSLTS